MRKMKILLIFILAFAVMIPAAQAAAWFTETVDNSADGVGSDTSLAIDPSGNPHISYHDAINNYLKHAWKDGSGWHTETADLLQFNLGQFTSLAFDPSGYPHISYYDAYLRHAWKDGSGTGWHTETVDSEGYGGDTSSLAFDPGGYPHISYTTTYLKHAWKDGSGTGWHTETVDSEGSVGYTSSLTFDPGGYPHISYYDSTNDNLKHAWKDSIATGWQTEIVDSEGNVGMDTSLAFDPSGFPHISYYDYTNYDLKHAWKDGTGWHTEIVDSEGDVGYYNSLAIGPGGYPHISYLDTTNGDLKYARLSIIMSTRWWQRETVDSAWTVGGYNSLAFDPSGNPHISYYDYTNEDLKHAYLSPGSVGYSVSILGLQNTVITAANGAFGSMHRNEYSTIPSSVVLSNTGDASAKVEARFIDSISGVFGLVSDIDVLPAINFELGPTGSLVPLKDNGEDVQVATVAAGGTRNLDAKLTVPDDQALGTYDGNVILTFSNE